MTAPLLGIWLDATYSDDDTSDYGVSGDALATVDDEQVTRDRSTLWAYERLWGTTAPLRFDPATRNRRLVAKGETIVSPFGETPVTVATHDANRLGVNDPVRYLI